MASVTDSSAATGTNPYLTGTDAGTAARIPQKTLGQNDFLKLLATQFQKQDPMKPMEDTAFIAQMAQFTALEQSGAMTQELAALRADQLQATANSYLGHRVTVTGADGVAVTGTVSAIDRGGDKPLLVVGGESYALSSVLRVEPGLLTSQQPASPTGAST
jgi:flagellar basal-body rod modification protein FlgD